MIDCLKHNMNAMPVFIDLNIETTDLRFVRSLLQFGGVPNVARYVKLKP